MSKPKCKRCLKNVQVVLVITEMYSRPAVTCTSARRKATKY